MTERRECPTCDYCGKVAKLEDSAIIYGKSYGMIVIGGWK